VNPGTARQLVLVSFVVSGGVIVYDIVDGGSKLTGDQEFKAVWSLSLLFLLLAMMSDLVPGLAGPFAALVTLAILVGRGQALQAIVNVGTKPATK
jgi:hypothetical protein